MRGYNIIQTATLLGIKVRTVREWIRIGKINAFKQKNGRWIVPEKEIERIKDDYTTTKHSE